MPLGRSLGHAHAAPGELCIKYGIAATERGFRAQKNRHNSTEKAVEPPISKEFLRLHSLQVILLSPLLASVFKHHNIIGL